jgi:hypothetical protein
VPSALVAASGLTIVLAACGASKPMLSSAQVSKRTCKQVEAALSDGPDPEADAVGHAQAQILPLREIHTVDGALHRAIYALAAAYQLFSSTMGSSSAKSAVGAASKTIERLCPGIES